jgi:hypothetical protein
MGENDERAAARARGGKKELSEAGLKRFMMYVEIGLLQVRPCVYDEARFHIGMCDCHRDEALANFEKNCEYGGLPSPTNPEIGKEDWNVSGMENSIIHLARVYAEPVIKALLGPPEQD